MKTCCYVHALAAYLFLILLCVPPVSAQKLYWVDSFITEVWKANPDGTGAQQITPPDGLGAPTQIAIDPAAGKIYLTDRGDSFFGVAPQLARMNLDGSGFEVLATGFQEPWGLTLSLQAGKV